MNQVHIVTILSGGRVAYQFVCYDDSERANNLAGRVMDSLADHYGGDWDYSVCAAPYVGSTTSNSTLIEDAHAKVTIA